MFSDVGVVRILGCVGLLVVLLLLSGVEARPTRDIIPSKDEVSKLNVPESNDVLTLESVPLWKTLNHVFVESFKLDNRESDQHRRHRRIRRRIPSNTNGNQQNPKEPGGKLNGAEFQNNISTTNYYRHRNGWGGGYGK